MKTASIFLIASLILVTSYAQRANQEVLDQAATLMEQKCFICHSPTADQTNRLAPPMAAVKMHYISSYPDKDMFVSAVSAFVQDPAEDMTLMHGAVRRFKVMPKQEFNQEEVQAIAAFIYENDLTEPEWFADHKQEMMGSHGQGKGKGKGQGQGKGMMHKEGNGNGCQQCGQGQGQCKMHGSEK